MCNIKRQQEHACVLCGSPLHLAAVSHCLHCCEVQQEHTRRLCQEATAAVGGPTQEERTVGSMPGMHRLATVEAHGHGCGGSTQEAGAYVRRKAAAYQEDVAAARLRAGGPCREALQVPDCALLRAAKSQRKTTNQKFACTHTRARSAHANSNV